MDAGRLFKAGESRKGADNGSRRGRHLSYQRGKRNTNPGTSLIKIEGVDNTDAAKYVERSRGMGMDDC
jgi:ribosomal protein L35AE/L33A